MKVVAACQKPDQKALEAELSSFPAAIEAVSRAKEANRRERDWLSHLTLLGEGAPAIGWVVNVCGKIKLAEFTIFMSLSQNPFNS